MGSDDNDVDPFLLFKSTNLRVPSDKATAAIFTERGEHLASKTKATYVIACLYVYVCLYINIHTYI